MNYFYKLVKNHVVCTRSDMPILMSDDLCSGPYDKSSIPPGCTDSAYNIVLRALAREPLRDDPRVSVEDGGDKDTYMLQWLGIRNDEIERARLVTRIVDRIDAKRKSAETAQKK